MADTTPTGATRQSALSGHYTPGRFGTQRSTASELIVAERRPLAIAQINGAPEPAALAAALSAMGVKTPPEVNRVLSIDGFSLLWNGPDMWLAESNQSEPRAFVAALRSALADSDATVTDLAHARTVLRLRGAALPALLCQGCSADIESLTPGDCMVTQLGHFSVLIHSFDGQFGMDIYVYRSFGLALWEWITAAAAEFGYRVQPVEV